MTPIHLVTLIAVRNLGQDSRAVTLREEVADRIDRDVSLAAIYAALDTLEQEGLVRPWLSDPRPERGGRARKHFTITPRGVEVLGRERRQTERVWHGLGRIPGSRRS